MASEGLGFSEAHGVVDVEETRRVLRRSPLDDIEETLDGVCVVVVKMSRVVWWSAWRSARIFAAFRCACVFVLKRERSRSLIVARTEKLSRFRTGSTTDGRNELSVLRSRVVNIVFRVRLTLSKSDTNSAFASAVRRYLIFQKSDVSFELDPVLLAMFRAR